MPSRAHSITAGAILLVALTFIRIRPVGAQARPPDLQMLLNLDLFSSSGADNSQGPAPGGSMLDQIRALRQMGYLGANPDAPYPPYGAGGGPYPPYGAEDGPYLPNDPEGGDTLVPYIFDFLGGNQ